MDPADFNPKKDLKGKAKETEAFESWVDETVNEYAKMGDFPRDKEIEKKDKENATKLDVTKADKMMNTTAYKRMQAGDERYADKTEGMGDKIADMAQSMSKEEFMSKADELGLSQEEAAEHYEKMQGGAHAGKFEGNQFAQAVQKAKAAGMKAGDKFKVGDQEYTLKDAIEMAGLDLNEFYTEEEIAYDNQIDRIKNLALYQ